MQLDGEAFVKEAYAVLLGRYPDPEGFMYYMARLRRGISKRRIILQLLKAPEAVAMKEKNAEFRRDVGEWQKKTASIKYALESLPNIWTKKKYSSNIVNNPGTEINIGDLIGQLNAVLGNQTRMNDEIAALRTALSNMVDMKSAYRQDSHQLSRQAQHIYDSLIQSTSDAGPNANSY